MAKELKEEKKKSPVKKTSTRKKKSPKIEEYKATGRRKDAVVRLILRPGKGVFSLNKRALENYFPYENLRILVKKPLALTKTLGQFDVMAKLEGGGTSGQAGALQLGIARALVEYDETFKELLKKAGLLTRDSRMKERRKYGLKKARKAPQFSKR